MERKEKTFPEKMLPITEKIIRERLNRLLEERKKIGEAGIPWPHEGPAIHAKLQQVEAEISFLQKILNNSRIYKIPSSFSEIKLGVGVRISKTNSRAEEEENIGFVSSIDVRYLPKTEGITWVSPESLFGKTIEGKKPQDEFNYTDPEGNHWKIKILELFSLGPTLEKLLLNYY